MREKIVSHPTFIPFQPFIVSAHVLRISATILFLLIKFSYWHVRVPSRVTFLRCEFHGTYRVTFFWDMKFMALTVTFLETWSAWPLVTFLRREHGPYRVTCLRCELHGPYSYIFWDMNFMALTELHFWDVNFMTPTELHFLRREVHGPYRVTFFETWSSWPLQSYIFLETWISWPLQSYISEAWNSWPLQLRFWDVNFTALTVTFLRLEVHGPYRATFLRREFHGSYSYIFETWSSWPLQSYNFMALTVTFLRLEVHGPYRVTFLRREAWTNEWKWIHGA